MLFRELNPFKKLLPGFGAYCDGGRVFPESEASWGSAYPSVVAPTAIYTCQEASDSLIDAVGDIDLAPSGTVGYREAGDPLGRYSVSLGSTSAKFVAASAASFDIDDVTSLSVLIRASFPATAAATSIIGKRTATGNLEGYAMTLQVTTSLPLSFVDPGAAGNVVATGPTAADDEIFRDFLFVVDRTGQNVVQTSQLGTASASIAAIGTLTNTGLFAIGQSAGATNALAGTKVSYCAVWVGTALTQANYNAIVAG